MADFKVSLSLKGIGPHKDTSFEENVSSINMAIFAENGSGKSFISKSFKRITDLAYLKADEEDENRLRNKTSAMIRFGDSKGCMHFGITPQNETEKSLDIIFENEQLPKINDTSGLIYHVFNSEYVKENLESVNYKPEDNVSGFILGKVNIDLSKEKQTLMGLMDDFDKFKKSIEQSIDDGRQELKNLQIQSNTSEFIKITYDNIKTLKLTDEVQDFNSLKARYSKLINMPNDLADIGFSTFPDVNQIKSLVESINELLLTEYSLSNFAEEFKENVKNKQNFIETGLQLSDGKNCPFCGQSYSDKANALIDMYTAFLKDEEAKVVNSIINIQKSIQNVIESFINCEDRNKIAIAQYDSMKTYFPSLETTKLDLIDTELLIKVLKKFIDILEKKKQDISNSKFDIKEITNEIGALLTENLEIAQNNNMLIKTLNSNKNDINKERLGLRKALCNAKFNSIIESCKEAFDNMGKLDEKIQKLKKEIEDKESQAKIDRRKMLITELKHYLSLFFADKYDFDEENFCVKFQNKALIKNTDDVLSDGEKSILAFCFYLANIHGIVSKAEDYNRILFIIDDPVSSMDFNYVYNVAQVIRDLKKHEQIKRVRYIVLTHNMEFMSILVRNKIVSKKYILSHGGFTDFKDNYVMPYTYNLLDIYNESIGKGCHSHTIPNSIRHVLETIYHFEGTKSVNDNFEGYIANNEILSQNGNLYSLINDHSHGAIRNSNGYTEEILVNACKTVIAFIKDRYPGQITEIETLLQINNSTVGGA